MQWSKKGIQWLGSKNNHHLRHLYEYTRFSVFTLILTIMTYYLCINHADQGFLQFQLITDVLVRSFRFIWIPILWVYGYYKSITLLVRGSTLDGRIWRRYTSDSKVDPRAERVNNNYTIIMRVTWIRLSLITAACGMLGMILLQFSTHSTWRAYKFDKSRQVLISLTRLFSNSGVCFTEKISS